MLSPNLEILVGENAVVYFGNFSWRKCCHLFLYNAAPYIFNRLSFVSMCKFYASWWTYKSEHCALQCKYSIIQWWYINISKHVHTLIDNYNDKLHFQRLRTTCASSLLDRVETHKQKTTHRNIIVGTFIDWETTELYMINFYSHISLRIIKCNILLTITM